MPAQRTSRAATRLTRGFVLRWAGLAVRVLEDAREQIDEANVFPVADSDTGSNLLLTVRHGAEALDGLAATATGFDAMRAFARGALLGARGNSGIIVSEFLRGFASGMTPDDGSDTPGSDAPAEGTLGDEGNEAEPVDGLTVDGVPADGATVLARCLRLAARAAYSAVADPVQGTILTTADGAANSAGEVATRGASASEVLLAACAGARAALARSPQELDVLRRSGVLDAGAFGLTLLLEAAVHSFVGNEDDVAELPDLELPDLGMPALRLEAGAQPEKGDVDEQCHDHGDGEFEVMFLLETASPEANPDVADALRTDLARIGRSVVVVGGEGTWQAHVHTDEPASALACVEHGRMRQICVRHLSDPSEVVPVLRAPGLVVGTSSPGLIPDMARAGAVVLVSPEGGWREEEVRRAVMDAGTPRVVILAPSGKDAATARRLGTPVRDVEVQVLDTPTDLHAIVALTAAAEMLDAIPSSSGMAMRDSQKFPDAMAQSITELGHTVLLDAAEVATKEVNRAVAALPGLGSLGLALVLHGDGAPPEFLARCVDAITSEFGGVELVTLPSGRPDARVRIGVL